MERRLAAILAADVVGYSRLMEIDEAGTLVALKAHRSEFIDPVIAEYGGRIVKLMGDGALVEFPSVVDAVASAVAVQRGMVERNADVPPDERIEFRIGISLGDVIIEGDDIYGDGVNVAARVEALAEPGSIALSSYAHDHITGKVEFAFEDTGEHELKNIARPIRVWRWSEAVPAPEAKSGGAASLPLPNKPSIAVLPFDNMSGDPEQDYFADGICEDLITALSKIRWFFVIARNSSFTYKGHAVEVTQVARELGVRYVIEGSVRKAGNRVRITAQLIDATSGRHVWAERYDRGLEDIFDLQDEMTQTIAGAVEPELSAAERERAVRKAPDNLDAWETFQRGLWHLWHFSKNEIADARRILRHAQELDPGFATAYAYEAYCHVLETMLGFSAEPEESLAAGLSLAKISLAADEKDPMTHFALGRVYSLLGKHDESVTELETAIGLNPSFAQAYHGLGTVLLFSGRLEEAAEALDQAMRLSPRDPVMWGTLSYRSMTCALMRQFDEAAVWARRAVQEPRAIQGGYWAYAVLASALGNLGQTAEAREALGEALLRKPDLSMSYLRKTLLTKNPAGLDPYLDGLRKAGLPE